MELLAYGFATLIVIIAFILLLLRKTDVDIFDDNQTIHEKRKLHPRRIKPNTINKCVNN